MRRPPPSLRGRALMWLAQREHTRQELAQKLRRWVKALEARPSLGDQPATPRPAIDAGEVESLLDKLQADGHLCERRFVESRVHARSARFGNRRIEQELRRLGVALDEPARAELRASETARARHLWATRYRRPAADAAERLRQMRFLAGRGFSAEVIRRVVAGGEAEDDPPDNEG
jgi:regulatory protein